ncbi:MAG: beta-ketoacyl synthase [Bacteroidetes bacterium]|nr:beta-ketoacyl synthase [Bacteroidota bacterium]MBS1974249.1 beta-ketoacyl synthase [Bacteroidota bacterium]
MKNVFVVSDNILSPLGPTSQLNFDALKKAKSGIQRHEDKKLCAAPFYASLLSKNETDQKTTSAPFTRFEQLLIYSISDALNKTKVDIQDKKTVLIVSSTKGNINLIETEPFSEKLRERTALFTSAQMIASHFSHPNKPVIVSNACISGLLALLTGYRLLLSGQYENAVVAGCDVITKFILSGFQSFLAVSALPCKPFDAARDGVTLGEGAATVVLSVQKKAQDNILLSGGSVTNDANHISGPSRTGEELAHAINNAMHSAGLGPKEIDFISAHGTATLYNDEMEAKAISLTGLEKVPVNSVKGNYGHTLGAAGLIESVMTIHSMKENIILPTQNFSRSGVSKPINICSILQPAELRNCLKTASGFGGCNAALIFRKI